METKDLEKIGNFILKYYKEPVLEKFELPRKKKIITKTIEVDEPVKKTVTVTVTNPVPGSIILTGGILLGLLLFKVNPIISVVFIVVGIIGGIIAFKFLKKKKTERKTVTEKVKRTIEEEIELPPEYEYREVPQKYSIRSLGKINLKFYLAKIDDSSLLIPESHALSKKQFLFPTIEKYKVFKKEDAEIEKKTESIPFVLNGESEEQPLDIETTYGKKVVLRGYEKDLNAYLQNTEEIFSRIKKVKFGIPIVQDSQLPKHFIKSANKVSISVSDSLTSLINSEEGFELDDFLKLWLTQWPSRVMLMNKVRINSLQNDVSPEFYELGQVSQYTSFNFYCPACNKEIQEDILSRDYSVQAESTPNEIYFSKNTRCKFDPVKNTWKCPVCNHSFKQPIPVHKIMDELFLPVYDKLMEENKVEREKHHSEMRKKEIEMRYKMKEELEKVYFEHISGIFELQSEMDKMHAEIEGESDAIVYMEEVARKQKDFHSEVSESIIRENEEMKHRLEEQGRHVKEQMEEFTTNELERYKEEMDVLSHAKRIEDERKQKEIVGALEKIETAVHENTEAVHENTNAVREGTEAIREGTEATKELKDVTEKGFSETNKNLKRNNAIQVAMAEKQGIDLHDEGALRIGKKLKNFKTDIVGKLKGSSTIEIEEEKLN